MPGFLCGLHTSDTGDLLQSIAASISLNLRLKFTRLNQTFMVRFFNICF